MNKLCVFVIVAALVSLASAQTYMGPTTSILELEQPGLGFDFSQSDISVRLETDRASEVIDIEASIYFARLLFGAGNGSEVSFRMGFSTIKEDADNGLSSDTELAWGLGTKIKLGETGSVGWGAVLQLTALYGEDSIRVGPYLVEGEFEAYEIQVALGPSFRAESLCVYGGPMLHLITGEIKDTTIDIKQESEFGGYVGLGWQFAENSHLNVEYQATSDAEALGIGLLFRFSGPSKPDKRTITTYKPPTKLKPEPEFDATGRKIIGYKVKRDASGEDIAKDENGNFIFIPIYEDEQEK